nr:MAG TPA: hypothetical protein [Caudoviricetes sp.]
MIVFDENRQKDLLFLKSYGIIKVQQRKHKTK